LPIVLLLPVEVVVADGRMLLEEQAVELPEVLEPTTLLVEVPKQRVVLLELTRLVAKKRQVHWVKVVQVLDHLLVAAAVAAVTTVVVAVVTIKVVEVDPHTSAE
jgi:hypothetical protein